MTNFAHFTKKQLMENNPSLGLKQSMLHATMVKIVQDAHSKKKTPEAKTVPNDGNEKMRY